MTENTIQCMYMIKFANKKVQWLNEWKVQYFVQLLNPREYTEQSNVDYMHAVYTLDIADE